MIEPAHLWIPDRVGSYGDEAVDLAADAGKTLDEEQRLAVDAMLSFGPGGNWVALEQGILEPRQNGKSSGVILPVVLFDLFLRDDKPDRIVWTAHRFKTSREAFDDFIACIEFSAALSRRVKKVSTSHGEEFIELHKPKKTKKTDPTRGGKLEFLARERQGGRGLGGKRVVLDEALILSSGAVGALLPTLSARDDPQVTYGSSASKDNSTQLHKLVTRGRKGGDPSLIWIEWCADGSWENPPCATGRKCLHAPGASGCALDDEEAWQRANPALKRRITIEYVRSERRTLDALEFGRERLGWHEVPVDEAGAIDLVGWAKSLDPGSKRHGDMTFAVDITPAQDSAAVAMFGIREDGLEHMQLMDVRPGTDWIVPRMAELRDLHNPVGWAMGRGTFKALEADLLKAGFKRPAKKTGDEPEPERGDVEVVMGGDMSACCGQMLNATRPVINDDGEPEYRYRHIGQAELDTAVSAARIRETSDAVVWSRKDSTASIAPIVAVSEARWLFHSWAHLVNNDYDVLESVF